MDLEITSQPYQHGRRWHVDYRSADGCMVNRLSFNEKPDQKTIDATLTSVKTRMDADAAAAVIEDAKEATWQEWLEKEGGLDEVREKVITDPTIELKPKAVEVPK